MWLRILGLPEGMEPWWCAENLAVEDGAQLDRLLRHRLPGYRFQLNGKPLVRLTGQELASRELTPGRHLTVVARPGDAAGSTERGSGPEVLMVTEAGPDGGRLVPLPRSGVTVGRNHADVRLADPFLSSPHFRAVVEPDGVRIVLLTGPRAETPSGPALRGPWTGSRPWTAGSSAFRLFRGRHDPLPPREALPALAVDPGPEPSRPNPVLQAVMAAGPLVIGIVMAVVTGLWYFLLFSLVSVAMAGVMWAQHRTARSRHGRRIRLEVRSLADRLETVAPDPARLALAARSSAPDRFGVGGPAVGAPLVRWGTGTAVLPVTTGEGHRDWSAWSTTELPIVSELRAEAATRVTGQHSTLEAMARWLAVQLCRDAASSGRGLLMRTAEGDDWLGGGPTAAAGTAVLHPGASARGVPEHWHQVRLTASGGPSDHHDVLDRVDPDDGTATIAGLECTAFRWHGMSATTADWLIDEIGASPRPRMTARVPNLTLPDPAMRGTAVDSLECLLAAGDDPVTFDAVLDGPHALVAGTTGSGKSELLLTVLTGLAAAYPPAEVSFVLMDFKGGSSFAPLMSLPHTMSVETNLVEAESLRTVDALTAELRRREELFLAAGTPDFQAYRRSHPGQVLPRLVVAVDELRVLVEDHPQASAVLARLAATGRSLGFHLLLSTQRAQGAVSPDVRSNLGTVVCLRTATEQESWDLLGSPDAFSIDADAPGRAFIKRGGSPPRQFQAGRFTPPAEPPTLRPWCGGAAPQAAAASWPELARRLREEAGSQGIVLPPPVVMPALPGRWNPTAADRLAVPGSVVVGLADLPRHRRQRPVHWVPGHDAPAAWIGTDAGGLHGAARSVVDQWAHPPSPSAERMAGPQQGLLTFVLDGTGRLEPPRRWTVLSPDQATAELLGTVLDTLREALAEHRPVRVLITSWGRWAQRRVGTGYETLEEHLSVLIRDHPPNLLAIALFGGRDLAGSRALGHVPTRFYIPAGSTPEQRMVWPTLERVREVPGRAVMVSPEHPAPGIAVQLACDPPSSGVPPSSATASAEQPMVPPPTEAENNLPSPHHA